jgi:hypothetical protein
MAALAQTLARISAQAYSDTASPPPGFTALEIGGAVGGVFRNENAAAHVLEGTLGGREVVVLAFRGSDDRQDKINDLQKIDRDYPKFAGLIVGIDEYALANGLDVVVTGHSLGGSLAQEFMVLHRNDAVSYNAVTFGSPGSLGVAGPDDRVTNYELANDPLVFAGLNRGDIAQRAARDPAYTIKLATATSQASGLSAEDVLGSLSFLTENYDNRGNTVVLGGPSVLTVGNFFEADTRVHSIESYIAATADAADPVFVTTPDLVGDFDRQFYLLNNPDVRAAGVDSYDHFMARGWIEGRNPDAYFDTRGYLAHNPDVAAAGVNPLVHYQENGWREGRDPSPDFDTSEYLQNYPDVAAAGIDPLQHFLQFGRAEGRLSYGDGLWDGSQGLGLA